MCQTAPIDDLFEKWKNERKPAASTVSTWNTAPASPKGHLGHDNGVKVRDTDIVAWKDKLVAASLSPKSINGSCLALANTLFDFAVSNKLPATNPAKDVRVAAPKRAGTGMLPYADAARLLGLVKVTMPARRWPIWLAASSCAGIGELAQLWGERVFVEAGVYVMTSASAVPTLHAKYLHGRRNNRLK